MEPKPQAPYVHWMVANPYKMGVVTVVGDPRDALKAIPRSLTDVRRIVRDKMPNELKDGLLRRYGVEATRAKRLCDAGTTQRFGVDVYVWFPKLPDLPTLIHELDHVATIILDFSGVADTGEGNEAHAYLMTSLCGHFCKVFHEDLKKEKLEWYGK